MDDLEDTLDVSEEGGDDESPLACRVIWLIRCQLRRASSELLALVSGEDFTLSLLGECGSCGDMRVR